MYCITERDTTCLSEREKRSACVCFQEFESSNDLDDMVSSLWPLPRALDVEGDEGIDLLFTNSSTGGGPLHEEVRSQ